MKNLIIFAQRLLKIFIKLKMIKSFSNKGLMIILFFHTFQGITRKHHDIIDELAKQIIFSSDAEMKTFLQVVMDFCNYCPRDDLNGRTPEDIETYEKGSWEKRLTHDLMNYIQIKVNPSEFNNKNELGKEIEKYQEEWLHQPQDELDNKSPWTVILEERKSLNNPRKDFSIKIDITPIDGGSKSSVSLSKIKSKDVPLAKDLETFVQYFTENRVKVTQKKSVGTV